MLFLAGIEKLPREKILDLLTFLDGPGVTTYMTDNISKFVNNILPSNWQTKSRSIEESLEKKRQELDKFKDEQLRIELKNWFSRSSGVSKEDLDDPEKIARACLQKTAETLGMKGDFRDVSGLERVIVERYMRNIGDKIEEMMLQMEPENLDKFPDRFREELNKYSFIDTEHLLSQINFKGSTSKSISDSIKKTLIAGAGIGLVKSMGFSAFIMLSSAIASAGGLIGITLPFFVYTGASSILSFLLGPAGFGLIFMGLGSQSIWKANERILRERMLLAIIVMHAFMIESMQEKKLLKN